MEFGPLDALHLALAEKAAARWFVTTDDQLLRRAAGRREQILVEVVTPDEVLAMEVSDEQVLFDVQLRDPARRMESADRSARARRCDAVHDEYDPGRGDYSKERHEIFADLELDELLAAIRRHDLR